MDVGGSSFEAFADAFRAARDLPADAQLDVEAGTALVFADVCAARAQVRDVVAPLDDTDADEWVTEANTWKLVHALFVERLAVQHAPIEPAPHAYEPPLATVQRILAADAELAELKILRDWLQEILPPSHAVEVRKGYLPFTKHALQAEQRMTGAGPSSSSRRGGRLVQQLDPDAPVRGPGVWDVEDAHYDRALVRTLFEYVRSGQLSAALDLCQQSSQTWRAASLRGGLFYYDPALVVGDDALELDAPLGNRARGVWRRIARKAAANLALDAHERALYGALCGDLASVLAVIESWDERLWAYVNARFEQRLEQALAAAAPSAWVVDAGGHASTAESSESLDSIFEQLAQAQAPSAAAAAEPYHVAQRAIVTNSVPDLLARVCARLREMEQLAPSMYARLVRFFAHLALYCHLVHVPVPVPVRAPILNAYVGVLQRAGQSSELVALYASSLERENADVVYAEFLCAMDVDAPLDVRRAALLQAQPYGLDPAIVARCTVQMALGELLPNVTHSSEIRAWNDALSADERRLVLAVDWLTFFDATYADAIVQTNRLMRAFMATGRLHVAHSLLQRLPPELLAALDTLDVRADEVLELDHWRSYFDVVGKSVVVRGLWSDAALVASSHAEHHAWRSALVAACDDARLAHLELFELGWLQLDVDDAHRRAELALVRRKYVPELVLSLHLMLVDTSDELPENLAHALALPNTVADERLRLYAEFGEPGVAHNGLRAYLAHVREASILALDRRLDVGVAAA